MSIIYNGKSVAGKYNISSVTNASDISAGIIKIATEDELLDSLNNETAITPHLLNEVSKRNSFNNSRITNCVTEIPQDIKLELEPLNANIVGSVTNNIGVISGFSANNYLTLPNTFNTGQNWEIVFKVTVAESQYTYQCLLGYTYVMAFCVKTTTEGMVVHFNLGDGSTWSSGCNGTEKLIAGETYWLKASKVGNVTTVQHSIDNQTWITDGTLETSLASQAQLWVGNINSTNQQFYGSIDLPNCYIKVNNSIWWQGGTGALTLKAGSKIYKPDSTEINIERDYSITATYADGILFYDIENDVFGWRQKNECYSQDIAPTATQYMLWHDTTNNKIKVTPDTGATWTECALPVGTFTANSTQITSIDEVFNGFGYIGSTVFVLPNIKGFIPNGRNEDGTLNNIEVVTKEVTIRTSTSAFNFDLALYPNGSINTTHIANSRNDEKNNYYYTGSTRLQSMSLGTGSFTTSGVSSLNPKLPFRAVDYNDYTNGVGSTKAYITKTYRNGASWYRIWSDGWCEQGGYFKQSTSGNQTNTITFIKPFSNTNYCLLGSYLNSSETNGTWSSHIGSAWISKQTTGFTRKTFQTDYNWYACGYINQ